MERWAAGGKALDLLRQHPWLALFHAGDDFLVLAAATQEGGSRLNHAQLAERTGLSKRGVKQALLHLVNRNLLRVERRGTTDVPRYEPLTPRHRPALKTR